MNNHSRIGIRALMHRGVLLRFEHGFQEGHAPGGLASLAGQRVAGERAEPLAVLGVRAKRSACLAEKCGAKLKCVRVLGYDDGSGDRNAVRRRTA